MGTLGNSSFLLRDVRFSNVKPQVMNSIELSTLTFSKDQIHEQLQKIIADPVFSVSDILKRFLLFVAEETLEGRSNQIKEYTIGLKVLNKPYGFNPRQDAIVRIHAGRLRRALNHYYRGGGALDPIHVSIPKGSYLPVFAANTHEGIGEEGGHHVAEAYHSNPIAGTIGQYMVTGNMQYADDRLRITIQMQNTETQEEIWNQVVEYKLTNSNAFDVQDDIAKKLVSAVGDFCRFMKQHVDSEGVMAVA